MTNNLNIPEERIDKIKKYHCAVEVALNTLGEKYKAIILFHLIGHTLKFNEIQKLVSQVTSKMLSQQLKDLKVDGIINRKLYPIVPLKKEYFLTEYGQSIITVVTALHEWGINYIKALDLTARPTMIHTYPPESGGREDCSKIYAYSSPF